MSDRRAPVQGEHGTKPPGTILWEEHEEAWTEYDRRWRSSQSAERIAERHGFGWSELCDLLGREPETWKPQRPE